MLTLNLETLGVTEEALTQAVLNELGLSKEEAVASLAEKLGVSLNKTGPNISNGDSVQTEQGESVATILTPGEANILKEAAAIQSRIFG